MKRRALLALPLAAACKRGGKKRVAVIPKSVAHIFWVSVEAGARAAGKEAGVEILWNGPALESDFPRQIQIVDSMVAQRVDGIAIAAAERQALVAAIERASDAGIPVVIFDSGADTEKYLSFIATDNVQAGRLGARKMGELLGGKGKVAMILHAPGSFSTMDREKGFKQVRDAEFPGLEVVVEQFAMGDQAKARSIVENALSAHSGLQGVFCSTEPAATGAMLALEARGLAGKVRMVTVDSSENLIEQMKQDKVHALVVQDPFGMGHRAVMSIVSRLKGATPPRRVDMEPHVVTKGDLDKPEVMKLLKPDIEKYR